MVGLLFSGALGCLESLSLSSNDLSEVALQALLDAKVSVQRLKLNENPRLRHGG